MLISIYIFFGAYYNDSHNLIVCRYLIADDRAIFMFRDGAQAWDAKDFLIEQERCQEVTIENKQYPGKYYEQV